MIQVNPPAPGVPPSPHPAPLMIAPVQTKDPAQLASAQSTSPSPSSSRALSQSSMQDGRSNEIALNSVILRAGYAGADVEGESGDGIVQTPFAVSSFAADFEILDDGKIIVVGPADDGTGLDFAVIRYNADGSLDDTFGTGGIVLTPIVSGENDRARSLDFQDDGSLIVAGLSSFNDFVVVRYSSEGILDLDFGQGGVFSLPGVDPSDSLGGMAVQPDGKIVLGGTRNVAMAALRLLADGSDLDSGFGTGGIATASLGADGGERRAMALQPDGRILVAGRNFTDQDVAIVRFDAEGSQEMDFGGIGHAQQSLVPGIDWAESIFLQEDGKIVAACLTSGVTNDMGVVRFDGEGIIDLGFSGDGFLVEPLASGQDIAYDVTVQADGRILVAGVADNQMTLVRLEGDSANLSVALVADPAEIFVGDELTLSAEVANASSTTVGGATLTALIPSGLTVTGTTPSCTGTSQLECPLGILAGGGTATVTIQLRADAAGTFSPQVAVSAQAVDPDPADNTATVSVSVLQAEPSGGCSLVKNRK